MKKTLVALAVTAFATSASALTVYEAEGTKVEFEGQIRLLLDNQGSKTVAYDPVTGKKDVAKSSKVRNHSNLGNDASRFIFRAQHDLTEDLYARGVVDFRFDGKAQADGFSDFYAKKAYVGVGSKQFGEVHFGRQDTIGDDISQAGFDKALGVNGSPLTKNGTEVLRYDYKGIEGLVLGAGYRFAENRDKDSKEVNPTSFKVNPITQNDEIDKRGLKSGYDLGAIYAFGNAKVAVGYSRDNYATGNDDRHNKDGVLLSGKYTIDALTLAGDYGYGIETYGATKERTHYINTGAKYQFTDDVAAYTNYAYAKTDTKTDGDLDGKVRKHGVVLGAEYKVHKNVLTFVEGKYQNTKSYNEDSKKISSKRDNAIGVGLRVFW